ncbi:biotin--[acetyl-CoA-carboxylase] ligase [Sphingomonas rhizophila]|uniref:biotin--[acetyl-CoA-carboxylase] ligase n=1 Tax=Sphingomonas rhizophila TaxID=2071607 RepID=UPI0031B5AF44
MLADSTAREGDWLVARRQSAGRGRHGRVWDSIPGNFLGSTLVELRPHDPSPSTLSLLAGLALVEAVTAIAPDRSLSLKWPNDLLLDGAKLAGVLIERSGDRVVVGTGVNLAGAPRIAGRQIAALDGETTPDTFAPILADRFAAWLDAWRTTRGQGIVDAWLARAHPVGSLLSVHSGPGQRIDGNFDGLDPDGALRLRLAGGAVEIVRAGDVTFSVE